VTDNGHSHTVNYHIAGSNPQDFLAGTGGGFISTVGTSTSTTGITVGIGNANADHSHTYSGTTSGISANHNHTVTVSGTTGNGTGGGLAHENRPPYFALAYIMKT
jgi:microcystin-dependent protein